MSDLRFQFDWEDPQGAKGPELRATWARLAISVGDTPVTRLIDHRSRSVRDSVYGPLYPLAEWLAMNWWALAHEVETPHVGRHRAFLKRHCVAAAGEGFAWPRLWIVPSGKITDLRWAAADLPDARVSFVSNGRLSTSTDSVREELGRFVSAVVARLESEGILNSPLQEEWAAIQAVDPDEAEFCAAAATLGRDPFAMDDADRAQLIEISGAVREDLVGEFFAATDFGYLARALRELNGMLEQVSHSAASLASLVELRNEPLPLDPALAPWSQGYECARTLRSRLGLNGDFLTTDGQIAQAVHADEESFERAILTTSAQGGDFDALVGPASDGNPAFITRKFFPESRRFAFCRGLFEYLTSKGPRTHALVSRAHSDRQRANRAFAAEFLAPAALLRERIEDVWIDEEQVDDIAAQCGVSPWVIRHQIENHQLAAIDSTGSETGLW